MEAFQFDKQFICLDQMTGCSNLIGFSEAVSALTAQPERAGFSLVVFDVNSMAQLNHLRGVQEGDRALRWIGLLLQAEMKLEVFRILGDQFAVIIQGVSEKDTEVLACRVYELLNQHAADFSLEAPLATAAVIHYSEQDCPEAADIFIQVGCAMRDAKRNAGRGYKAYRAGEIAMEVSVLQFKELARNFMSRLNFLRTALDASLDAAYTDPGTGLPNQRRAAEALQQNLGQASSDPQPCTVLLIDGDNLHRYNEISYAEGDEMIRKLGAAIRGSLRPEDFLARWRVGDEFLVILKHTCGSQAMAIGERICSHVAQASQDWLLPVTVSIGAAEFPAHGKSPEALFHSAELALEVSKRGGKNQVNCWAAVQG